MSTKKVSLFICVVRVNYHVAQTVSGVGRRDMVGVAGVVKSWLMETDEAGMYKPMKNNSRHFGKCRRKYSRA